jgi:hypothetical protein
MEKRDERTMSARPLAATQTAPTKPVARSAKRADRETETRRNRQATQDRPNEIDFFKRRRDHSATKNAARAVGNRRGERPAR